MKSVGEVMAIGRTFKQALGKGMRSLETGKSDGAVKFHDDLIEARLITPNPDRLGYIRFAFERGYTEEQVHELTSIDPWFLRQVREMVDLETELAQAIARDSVTREQLLAGQARRPLRYASWRAAWNVDAARQFARGARNWASRPSSIAWTPARPSSKASRRISIRATNRSAKPNVRRRKKVMILGSGPNRIGQGIEFDYCCCHASFALQEFGVESIMVNCNPETVSTDYDTSDRLYFEPLTLEEVLNICDTEKPDGVIVQFGGQTPLTLALPLKAAGVPIIGTDPENIDLAEDRKLFGKLLDDLKIPSPANGSATNVEEACAVARSIGFPVLVRPSYVLGGRAMVIAYDEDTVRRYMQEAVIVLARAPGADRPVPGRRHRSGRRRALPIRPARC